MSSDDKVEVDDVFSPGRALFRKLVHFFSYHFILTRKRPTTTRVAGFELDVPPTVFHPKVFVTSSFSRGFCSLSI